MVSSLPVGYRRGSTTTRVLGIMGMLGSPLFGVTTTFWMGSDSTQIIANWIGLFFLLSWMGNLIGMRRLLVTGNGKAAQILFVVQVAVLVLACGQQIQDTFLHDALVKGGMLYFICDMSWPTSMLLMLVTFGFIIKAKVWTDWRCWPTLVHGLSLPLFFAFAALLGKEKSGFAFLVPLIGAFFLTGLAVATSHETK